MPKKSVPEMQARKEGKPMAATNEKEFTKIIVTDSEGIKYTLEFNARVVKTMERKGFKLDTDYPVTMVEELFLGAFQMHHKGVSPERAKSIWECQNHKDELLGVLTKLYMKPLEDLMSEEQSEDENATPTWQTV